MLALFANTDLLALMTAHGLNPVSPSSELSFWELTGTYEEEIRSVDPFEARFTFTIDDDALTLTVDDDLNVVDVTEHKASDPA